MSPRRILATAAVLGLTAVILNTTTAPALTSPALTATNADDATQTIVLTGKRTVLTLPEVPAIGLSFIGGGDVHDETGANKVGEGYSHCSIVKLSVDVPPVITAHCTTTFGLADGMLHMASLRTYTPTGDGFEDSAWAITGGTGTYATARGDATVTKNDTPTPTYKFTLTLTTDT